MSDIAVDNGTSPPDSFKNVNEKRSSLAARVSVDSFGDEATASGTHGNVEKTGILARDHHKQSNTKDDRQSGENDGGVKLKRAVKVLSSGQLIKSVWNNIEEDSSNSTSSGKKNRERNRNVNASTQTKIVDSCHKDGGNRCSWSQDNQRVVKDGEVGSEKLADMIRLLAAPILASEVKTAIVESTNHSGKPLSADVADRCSTTAHHNHHHHHHHHHHHRQETEDGSKWYQTADVMARRPVVTIKSFDTIQMVRQTANNSATPTDRDRCPRCACHRRPPSSNADADQTVSSTQEERTTLDQLMTEMCGYSDRSRGSNHIGSLVKEKLKRSFLTTKHLRR